MEQVIIGGHFGTVDTSNTKVTPLMGGYVQDWTPDNMAEAIPTPGKLKKLHVELDDTPGGGTYTFTLHRAVGVGGWANTALTCTVAADGTLASDDVNEVAVAAGDVVCLECDPDGTPTGRNARWSVIFEGDNPNESILISQGRPSSTADGYLNLAGYTDYKSAIREADGVIPTPGKLKNLYVQLKVDPGSAGDAWTFDLYVNDVISDDGIGNPLSVTITEPNRTGNDTTHEITVAAGDRVCLKCTRTNTPLSGIDAIGITFVADTDGESIIMGAFIDALDSAATEYSKLCSYTSLNATEAEQYQLAQACILSDFYVQLDGPPGAGKKYTFTVRVEGASPGGGLVVEIAGGVNTEGNDTTNSVTVSDDEVINFMIVPDSSPTARLGGWGLKSVIVAAVWTGKVSGVTNPAKVMGVDVANIAKVKGVA